MLDLYLLWHELWCKCGAVSKYPFFVSVSVYKCLHVYE